MTGPWPFVMDWRRALALECETFPVSNLGVGHTREMKIE